MSLPCVLFASSCDLTPISLIRKVFNDQVPDGDKIDQNITAYPWKIDNKYYTTQINLCDVESRALIPAEVSDLVDGIVVCFDASNSKGLELAQDWLPFLAVNDPEIKVLVCNSCREDEGTQGISKTKALEWCVERGFELVELDPVLDEEEDFPDIVGIEQLRQTLHAHQWSNLEMKSDDRPHYQTNGHNEQLSDDELEQMQSFEDLFSGLSEMREQLMRMPREERLVAAEKMVNGFYNALGDSDDDNNLDDL